MVDTHPISSLIDASEAFSRLNGDQAREAEAYSLGVQAVIWGMQFVKGGLGFRRVFSSGGE
jgi:hypothetical protein